MFVLFFDSFFLSPAESTISMTHSEDEDAEICFGDEILQRRWKRVSFERVSRKKSKERFCETEKNDDDDEAGAM